MAKIKLTKGELKAQRDALQQFNRYLPTLRLKQQQLQQQVFEAVRLLRKQEQELAGARHAMTAWAPLLADPLVKRTDADGSLLFDMARYIRPEQVITSPAIIAGVPIPVLERVRFPECDYGLYDTPPWVDPVIARLRELVRHAIALKILEERHRLLQRELQVTTQRVNLFERVKIPEAIDNIRRITIYLGDQQANAVGIAKVAKRKIEQSAIS